MDDTAGSLTEPESGTAGQIKQDENMRQCARHEPAIGTISSSIEYEMTEEREPAPSYYRNPRRFIELTAHATPLPVWQAGGRNVETGNGGWPPTDKTSGTQHQATHHPPARDEQADEEDDGTGKQRKGGPDRIEWHDIAARNRWMAG